MARPGLEPGTPRFQISRGISWWFGASAEDLQTRRFPAVRTDSPFGPFGMVCLRRSLRLSLAQVEYLMWTSRIKLMQRGLTSATIVI
jgi:hypothetical protein